MSEFSRVILAAVAASLTLGAVQLASGRDLTGIGQDPTGTPETVVNRIAKADRADRAAAPGVRTQTIALRREGLPDTSFLVRIPLAQATRSGTPAPAKLRSGKLAVACEPVVSVLTEIARQLEPGRCVT